MSEQNDRNKTIEPLHELATSLLEEIGAEPQHRLDWLMRQSGETFGNILSRINSTTRSGQVEAQGFDGEGIIAGAGGSVPPEQEDKFILLNELMLDVQTFIAKKTADHEDAETIVRELAVAIPTVVNKLHLFADGNGRTSRILRYILRDGERLEANIIDSIVKKSSDVRYDTTPCRPIEESIMHEVKRLNETSEVSVIDDVVNKDSFSDDASEEILNKFPDLDPRVLTAYFDTSNFYETIRQIEKRNGVDRVSFSEVFGKICSVPGSLELFLETYRDIRKQRVQLLIQGLLGIRTIELALADKELEVKKWINLGRTRQGLSPIDPALLHSVQDFQIAYCETFSLQHECI